MTPALDARDEINAYLDDEGIQLKFDDNRGEGIDIADVGFPDELAPSVTLLNQMVEAGRILLDLDEHGRLRVL